MTQQYPQHFIEERIEHYKTLLDTTPKFMVSTNGEIEINPARSHRRKQYYKYKTMIKCYH